MVVVLPEPCKPAIIITDGGEEIFKSKAAQFVQEELESKQSHVVATRIDAKTREIEVTLVGDVVPPKTLKEIASRLPLAGLTKSELKVFQTGEQRIDVAALKSNLLGDLYRESQTLIEKKDKIISQLQEELTTVETNQQRLIGIPAELNALYPQIKHVVLSESPEWNKQTGWEKQNTVVLNVRASKPLSRIDQDRISQWLRTRLKSESIRLVVELSKT